MPKTNDRIEKIISNMTLEEKAAQMLQISDSCGKNTIPDKGTIGSYLFTEEENKLNLYLLPHEDDRQFVTAFNALTNGKKLPNPQVGQ